MAKKTLKEKAVKSIAWSAIDKLGSYAISFVIGIIIARILSPSDYGLIGMLAIFFAVSELFVNSGFSSALIQKKERTEEDFSTVFFFNVLVAVSFYIILYFVAPLIARFYEIPGLIIITRVLSITILLNSLSLVQHTQLIIKLNFKVQAVVTLVSNIISGSIGIYFAFKGFGVWALVSQRVTYSLLRSGINFYYNRWIPSCFFKLSSFRQLFGFSSKLLGAGILATFFNNVYSLIIGKLFLLEELGYYTKAKQYPELISGLIENTHQSVTYQILSDLQDDTEKMVSIYGKMMRMIVFIVIPSMTLLAFFSGPFIRFLLTNKWAPAIPLMQWFCFAKMITPISALNMNILKATGRSDLFLKVDVIKIPLMVLVLLITVPLGIKALVIGQFCTSFLSFFVNTYYPGKFYNFGAVRQFKEMGPVVFATLIMSIFSVGILTLIHNDFIKLLIGVPLSISVYFVSTYMMKIEETNELLIMLNSFLKKNKKQR